MSTHLAQNCTDVEMRVSFEARVLHVPFKLKSFLQENQGSSCVPESTNQQNLKLQFKLIHTYLL